MDMSSLLAGVVLALLSAAFGAYLAYRAFAVGKRVSWYAEHSSDSEPPEMESVVPAEEDDFESAEEVESRADVPDMMPEGL